ncbi:branched-chain-amino-acid transaminase [Candidatus Methylacidithermus pantelleriae]|uniref:Branched-chain-amino-acid aminotransferase n=1 Tax=Candidatus Methylacidithermus pantelleriae TaxID=2744239 RepID=A0A8J2FRL3_9BACT|nr:branched-chain-amino-acid transaminase [Candidatus Methylacidithermus pantelleriae]CAF0691989.1 Putative branched-chain-amino-acid aminotransferase [Candidatus Methylacidithermus pantelleriae]
MEIYINGEYYQPEDAKISVFDHGLLYGDGVFEGIRAYYGRVFCLQEHLQRLYQSAKAILLRIPLPQEKLLRAVLETCRRNRIENGYVRLLVTRGIGTLGLSPESCPSPTIVIIADSIRLYPERLYQEGLSLVTVPTQRHSAAALSPAIKSLNYLNNILAKIEGSLRGAQEAILLSEEGFVTECTGENLFVVKGEELLTPPVWAGALPGITRKVVMELARKNGYSVREEILTRYDLFVADEIFITGTAAEIAPVREVDGREVGDTRPGPVTRDLMEKFRELTRIEGVPIYS